MNMELYRKDGRKAGLYDICEWWIKAYPPDVFVKEPILIVEARMCMQNILIKRVKAVPSSNNDFKKVCPVCKGYGQYDWQMGGESVCKYCNGTGKLSKES